MEEVWNFLQAEFERVKDKIDDVMASFESEGEAAWMDHCNKLMKLNCDFDIPDWLNLLSSASQTVKRCLDEEPTGERLREVEWVEERLSAVCQKVLDYKDCWLSPSMTHAASRLKAQISRPFQEVMTSCMQEMTRLREKHGKELAEQTEQLLALQSEEEKLLCKINAYQEHHKNFEDYCQKRLAQLSM